MKFKFLIALIGLISSFSTSVMAADAAAGEAKAAACFGCHMQDGNSVVADFPKLAGQHEKYIINQLNAFKNGSRPSDIMVGMAAMLVTDEDVADVAAYFASKTITPAESDAALAKLGKEIYQGGNSATGIPACMGCHGPHGTGNPPAAYPALAGQHAGYIAAQLKLFRSGTRANDLNAMMRNAVAHMTDAEIDAVSNYVAGMKK